MSSLPIQSSIDREDIKNVVKDTYLYIRDGINNAFPLKGISGNDNLAQKFVSFVVLTIQLVFIFVLAYTIYYFIFKGYPRIAVDLLTFKFFNKVKLDEFIKERNILINNIKFLSSKFTSCMTPYAMYQSIYGPTNLYTLVQNFEQNKTKYYSKYKYDDQYHTSIKEYFLFYNKIDKVDSKIVWNKKENFTIPDYPFYELLLTYRKMNGEIDVHNTERGGKKSKDELMFELYKKEKAKQFITKTGLLEMKRSIKQLADEVKSMNRTLMDLPIIPYLMIPEDDKVIAIILKDFSSYQKLLLEKSVYSLASNKISDHGWYVIEYIYSLSDPKQYEKFAKEMPPYTNEDLNMIIYYLNLTREEKEVAEKRIMNYSIVGHGKLDHLKLKTIVSEKGTMNYSANVEFYEYIKKRPIFSHIYFAQNVKQDKLVVYEKIMSSYRLLGDCGLSELSELSEGGTGEGGIDIDATKMQLRLKNLQENGRTLKTLLTTVAYLNLFLNDYQQSVTQMYEKQVISDERFFMELWNPFVEDLVKNRIGNYFKRVFSSEGMGASYGKFKVWYEQLGTDLKRMIKAVFASFFTTAPVVKPQAVDTTDNTPS
jgi:hypothetical protein